jgi:hypothetical protein
MKRRRDDSVKPGAGIDNDLGRSYTRRNRSSTWSYGEEDQSKYDDDTNVPLADEVCDIQFMWATRDIFDDVNANSDIRGDSVNANSGPIKYGINRKQDDK